MAIWPTNLSLTQNATCHLLPVVPQAPAVCHVPCSDDASAPHDCLHDMHTLGARLFAALPLVRGQRLLGLLWIALPSTTTSTPTTLAPSPASLTHAPGDAAEALLSNPSVLQQLASAATLAFSPPIGAPVAHAAAAGEQQQQQQVEEVLCWRAGAAKRLWDACSLQALVEALGGCLAQHVAHSSLVEAHVQVRHVWVVARAVQCMQPCWQLRRVPLYLVRVRVSSMLWYRNAGLGRPQSCALSISLAC